MKKKNKQGKQRRFPKTPAAQIPDLPVDTLAECFAHPGINISSTDSRIETPPCETMRADAPSLLQSMRDNALSDVSVHVAVCESTVDSAPSDVSVNDAVYQSPVDNAPSDFSVSVAVCESPVDNALNDVSVSVDVCESPPSCCEGVLSEHDSGLPTTQLDSPGSNSTTYPWSIDGADGNKGIGFDGSGI